MGARLEDSGISRPGMNTIHSPASIFAADALVVGEDQVRVAITIDPGWLLRTDDEDPGTSDRGQFGPVCLRIS